MRPSIAHTLLAGIMLSTFVAQTLAIEVIPPKRFLVYKETDTGKSSGAALSDADAAAGKADLFGARTYTSKSTYLIVVDVETGEEMIVYYSNRFKGFVIFQNESDDDGEELTELSWFREPYLDSVDIPVSIRRKTVVRRFYHEGYSGSTEFDEEDDDLTFYTNVNSGSGDLATITLPALQSVGANRLVQAPRRIRLTGIYSTIGLEIQFYDEETETVSPGKSYSKWESKASRAYDAALTAIANGRYGTLTDEEGEDLEPGSHDYVAAAIKKYFLDRKFRDWGAEDDDGEPL
jgi:hypothetical protein